MRVAHAPGMPGTFSPLPRVSDPGMHHGTWVTHVPRCMPGSLTSGFIWSGWRGKRSRHSRLMRNPQFSVSGKRPMEKFLSVALTLFFVTTQWLQLLSYDKGPSIQAIKSHDRFSVYDNAIKSNVFFIPYVGVSSLVRSSILYLNMILSQGHNQVIILFFHWLDHLNSKAVYDKCRFTVINHRFKEY